MRISRMQPVKISTSLPTVAPYLPAVAQAWCSPFVPHAVARLPVIPCSCPKPRYRTYFLVHHTDAHQRSKLVSIQYLHIRKSYEIHWQPVNIASIQQFPARLFPRTRTVVHSSYLCLPHACLHFNERQQTQRYPAALLPYKHLGRKI